MRVPRLLAIALALVIAMAISASTAAAAIEAGGATTADITGTSGNDSLVRTPGNDLMRGWKGDDNLTGMDGDDVIYGGRGADTIDGGPGNDTILGGSAIETIYGGPGDDFIDGNRANDVAFMGPGDDTFRWDPGDASDVVEGEDGLDEMLFNGANGGETVDVSANGERVTFFRQPGTITMDLNDVEVSVFSALGGTDNITVNDLAGTDATKVELNLDAGLANGAGDGVADLVTVNGTAGDDNIAVAGSAGNVRVTGLTTSVAITSAEFANDALAINTLAGNDTVDTSRLAPGVVQLSVN